MLWGYFDESGEHRPDGGLKRLTLAGAMAPCEVWKALQADWATMLEDFGIAMFHMTHFEAWKGPFNFKVSNGERDYAKHEALLNRILDIMTNHLNEIVGFVAEPEAGKPAFDDAYDSNIAKLTKETAIQTFHSLEPVTLVFARHSDFKEARIRRYFDLWKCPEYDLRFGGVGEPSELPQLQAADVIAYEFSRWARDQRPEDDRYPLKRLKTGMKIKGTNARFLLNYVI